MAHSSLWAVVPAKQLAHSKTRLAAILNADERYDFVMAMLSDVLATLKASPVDGVLVVTSDERIVELATAMGVDGLVLKEDLGICDALDQAAVRLKQEGIEHMLVVPSDVPSIRVEDIEILISSHGVSPAVTLVEAGRDGGTNALICSPPDAIAFLFGKQSAARHKKAAKAAGIDPVTLNVSGLITDIDIPEDLLNFSKNISISKAYDYLSNKGIIQRLEKNKATSWHQKIAQTARLETGIPS